MLQTEYLTTVSQSRPVGRGYGTANSVHCKHSKHSILKHRRGERKNKQTETQETFPVSEP